MCARVRPSVRPYAKCCIYRERKWLLASGTTWVFIGNWHARYGVGRNCVILCKTELYLKILLALRSTRAACRCSEDPAEQTDAFCAKYTGNVKNAGLCLKLCEVLWVSPSTVGHNILWCRRT